MRGGWAVEERSKITSQTTSDDKKCAPRVYAPSVLVHFDPAQRRNSAHGLA